MAAPATQTWTLIEEQDRVFDPSELPVSVAQEIHRRHGKQIGVELPTALNAQKVVLRSSGYVGQIDLDGRQRLRIEPKVPVETIFGMLEVAYDLPSFRLLPGIADVADIQDLFETIVWQLARGVLDRARKGLAQEYVERSDTLPMVRGRIDIRASLRHYLRGSPVLDCVHEELTADIEDNRILAWTLHRLRRAPIQRSEVRATLGRAHRTRLGEVTLRPYEPKDCVGRAYDRMNLDYRPLHALCRFLLETLGPLEEGEGERFPAFLLDMPQLFERFVARWLESRIGPGRRVRAQRRVHLDSDRRYHFDIDLVIEDRITGQCLAVADTKYKGSSRLASSDVAQIVAYATSMGCDRGFLVYPQEMGQGAALRAGPVEVEAVSVPLGEGLMEAPGVLLERIVSDNITDPDMTVR
ncbi:MAG: McrC family protein [Myxococcota bacterium]